MMMLEMRELTDDDTEEIVVHDAAIATIRQRGKILRYKLKDEMPPR